MKVFLAFSLFLFSASLHAEEMPCKQVAVDVAEREFEAKNPSALDTRVVSNKFLSSSPGTVTWRIRLWEKFMERYSCYKVSLNERSCGVVGIEPTACD